MATYKGVKIDYSKDISKQIAAIDKGSTTAPPKGGTTTTPPKGGSSGSSSSSKGGSTTTAPKSTLDIITDPVTGKQFSRDTSIAGSTYAPYSSGSMGSTTSVPTSPTPTVSSGGQVSSTPKSTYTGNSIVDYLGSSGQASDYNSRAALAKQYGISNYTGTAEQNTGLLNSLRNASSSGISAPGATAQYTPPTAQGTQVTTKSVGGVEYQVTGDPVKDAANLKAAQNEASRIKQAERDKERLQQNQQNATQQQDITNQGLIQQLIALQKQQQLDVAPKINDLSYLRSRNSQQIANTLGSAGDESLQTGRAEIYNQQATAQEAVKQAEIDNILSNYQQRYGALGTGITATMPTQVTPGNSLINPQTGGQIYNGINQGIAYNNLVSQQETGRDLGYQATQIANVINQADSNVQTLLQTAGINFTPLTPVNELLQQVRQITGANTGNQTIFRQAFEGSIGRLLETSGLFTGDQVKAIRATQVDNTDAESLLKSYLAIKDQALAKYNALVAQGQTYNSAGAGSVIGNLQQQPLTGAFSSGAGNNDPDGIR